MADIDFIVDRLRHRGQAPCLVWQGQEISASMLVESIEIIEARLESEGLNPGDVVMLVGDFSPQAVAWLLALVRRRAIIVPALPSALDRPDEYAGVAQPKWRVTVDGPGGKACIEQFPVPTDHAHYQVLRQRGVTGLVLFTSGSTGQPKGVVHDFSSLLEKFRPSRKAYRMIAFLMFDHWGGLNTLFHGLSSGSVMVFPDTRMPDHICELIERYTVELLPTSPTFLNLLIMSGAHRRHNLSSLQLITYGAEPMPSATLAAVRKALPEVDMRQTYGLIELGVMRAKSLSNDSLWVKIGGDGYQTRIVDGLLEIKADAAMLGYLNAVSPFTDDGWFMTGDAVEERDGYYRIRGRASELVNVGGEKVYPAEVESVLLEFEKIEDAVVYGEPNPVTGAIVCADVLLHCETDVRDMRRQIKRHCAEHLEVFKVPVRIKFISGDLHGERMKRRRPTGVLAPGPNEERICND